MATRTLYYVGGTGNWSDTAHWSLSSGGAGGEAVPDSDDDVHFDAGSNTTNAAYTVTVDAAANCRDLMFDAKPGDGLGGTVTLAGSAALSVYGDLLLLSGMTSSHTGALTLAKVSGTQTITSNGVRINAGTLSLAGGGTVALADDLDFWGTTFGRSASTFNANGKTISLTRSTGCSVINDMTGTNAFFNLSRVPSAAGTAAFTLSAAIEVIGTLTITSFDSTTSRVLVQSNTLGTARTITAAAVALTNCDFMDITGAGAATWEGVLGAELLTDPGFDTPANWTPGTGWAVSGSAAVKSTADLSQIISTQATMIQAGRRYAVTLVTDGPAINVGLGAGNTVLMTSGVTRYINAGGAGTLKIVDTNGSFNGHSVISVSVKEVNALGDCLGNSGITFTPAADQYWYTPTTGTKTWSTAGNWFLGTGGTGGAGRVPLPQDNVIFNSASIGAASTTVSADMPRLGKDITWTGVTNTPAFSSAGVFLSIFGSLTLVSGMTFIMVNGLFYRGRGTHSITSAGKTHESTVSIDGFNGVFTLTDAFIAARYFSIQNCSVTCNGTVSATYFTVGTSTSANKTVDLGNSTHTAVQFSFHPTATLIPGASTLKMIPAAGIANTFAGFGLTYNNIWLAGAGSGSFNFTGSNTFNDFKISDGAKTINFTASTNTTVASMTGFEDNAATFDTVSGTGTFTLTKSGGGVIKMRGANVSRMTASPANTVYAGATGVDGGNNTDVIFNNAPAAASASITTDNATHTATATVAIAAAAALTTGDTQLTAAGATTIAGAAAFTADEATHIAAGATAIAGAAAFTADDAAHIATGAVAITGSAAITVDDDAMDATGYVWRLINDARYLRVVTSNRNIGPVKGIQL